MNRLKETDPKTAPYDDEPLVSGVNTHCVTIPDAWPARAVHRRVELLNGAGSPLNASGKSPGVTHDWCWTHCWANNGTTLNTTFTAW